jgi:hypothetical protein
MRRVADLKKYISDTYNVPSKKFSIVKIGPRIWLYIVTKENELGRSLLYTGALETADTNSVLKKYLVQKIEGALEKFDYWNPTNQ